METDCTVCRDNAQVYATNGLGGGRCVCSHGYVLSLDFNNCIIPHSTAKSHEFVFDSCGKQYESNDVTLFGDSYDSSMPAPTPVLNRGVFLNNKTFFTVEGLIFGSNFAMNAWIRSHDTGYGTIFSTNTERNWAQETIIDFSFRVANSKSGDRKRKNMLELKDWTSMESHF